MTQGDGSFVGAAEIPTSWVSSVSAAFSVGLLNTVLTVSLAAPVFSGDLAPFLPSDRSGAYR